MNDKVLQSACNECGVKIYTYEVDGQPESQATCFTGPAPSDCPVCGIRITSQYDDYEGYDVFTLHRKDSEYGDSVERCRPEITPVPGTTKPRKRRWVLIGAAGLLFVVILSVLSNAS